MADAVHQRDDTWHAFIDGPLYPEAQEPWRHDPAFAIITAHPGLRDSLGGHVAPALTLAIDLVQALTRVDLRQMVQAQRPAQGLSLGFGMHALEPYDLLQVFALDRVHAYEGIGAQVIESSRYSRKARLGPSAGGCKTPRPATPLPRPQGIAY
jgi:hypothetical protein